MYSINKISKIKHIHPKILERMYLFILWLIGKKETHGYGLIKKLKEGGIASARASRLYPLLNSMLNEGLISQSEERVGKRIKKVYMLTSKGRNALKNGKKLFSGLVKEFLGEMIK